MKNTIKILLVSIVVIALTKITLGQSTQEWVRFFDQPDNRNKLYASVTDKEGNTYLTGASMILNGNLSANDFLTLKYDKDGVLLWSSRFDSGDGGIDEANAITLDKEGNVYVTGFANSGTVELDEFYTIKYSPDGAEIWHANFNGPETGGIKWNDQAKYIFVDDDQNVYVTGEVQAIDDSTYYIHNNIGVVKYNSNGELEYSDVYDTPYHGDEIPTGISVNKYGYVFVAGHTAPQNEDIKVDMLLLMYDNNGNLRWNVQYDGSESNADEALLITTDKEGSAYLCGYQNKSATFSSADMYIAKYDTSGISVWHDAINSSVEGINPNLHYPVAMAIDENDNLYIHAYNTGYENFLVKYDLNGSRKWISFWNGTTNQAEPSNIAFDSENNIYVMGSNSSPDSLMNGSVLGAAKFDPDGNKIFEVMYEDHIVNDQGTWSNKPIGIGIDKDNNIYLTGDGGSGVDGQAFEVVKFSQSINAVSSNEIQPVRFGLEQNYPNPFNPTTTISFAIDKSEHVELDIYNSLGQLITKLIDEDKVAGNYRVVFNATHLPSGVYYYQLLAGNKIMTKKCILLK